MASRTRSLEIALQWAMEHVHEKIETAAGICCKHCGGTVARAHCKGLTTDPVEHTKDCTWVWARSLIARATGSTTEGEG